MASPTKEVLSSKQPSESVCIDLKPVLDVVESLSTPLPSVSLVENSSPVGALVQVDTQTDIDVSVAAKQIASRRRREHRDAYFAKRYEPEWMHSARLQAQPYRMPNFWSLAAHRTYGLWGRTRLMAAAHFGHIDRVELLLREHGADVHPSQTATNNRTALVEAEANGHSSTASLLRAYGAHPFSITLGEPHIASPVKTVISGKVLAIAVLPNGHIITGGEDGIINVWNAGDVSNSHWTCLQQMRGKHDLICALAVVSDRTHSISVKTLRVASGGSSSVILNSASVVEDNKKNNITDGFKEIKDIKETKETKESTSHLESSESAICLWKLSTSACEITLRGHKTRCTALASLRDGEWLASGGDNRTIRIWNILETSASFGSCVLKLRGHLGSINSITILPDNRLASSSSDGTIRLWTLPNDTLSIIAYCSTILTVPSEENDPSSSSSSVLSNKSTPLAISSIVAGLQKNRIAAARADGSVCVWDIQSGLLLDQQFGHRGAISVPLSSLPDGRLVSGGDDDDKTLRIWKIDINGSLIPLPEWKTKCPCGVSVISAASDGRVFTGFTDGTITAWK
jgi:WD40 repeat protein